MPEIKEAIRTTLYGTNKKPKPRSQIYKKMPHLRQYNRSIGSMKMFKADK